MAEEFEGRDLRGAVFWGVDLSGARFRDVNMTDVTITHAWVVNVDIDAMVDHVTVNGVDVTQYVNERDRWYPLRAMLRPTDPDGMRAAWDALEQAWASTIERARRLTEGQLHESVDEEWSFVETLRHLVFAMDKWFTTPILGEDEFHPVGLPNTGSADFGWPGLDRAVDPTFDEVLDVRAQRAARLRDYLEELTSADLLLEVDVLENGITPVNECLYVVFEEEFHHNRYAIRDLARLE
jgi:DinB superfamily/Pentapeptide repeats (8 copies)